jgi:hypothetical protein
MLKFTECRLTSCAWPSIQVLLTTNCVRLYSPVISVALKVRSEYTVYIKRTFTKKVPIISVARQSISGRGRLTVDVHRSHAPGWTTLREWSARHRGHYLHYKQETQQWDSKSRSSNQAAAGTGLTMNGHPIGENFHHKFHINFTPPLIISIRDFIQIYK